MKIMKDAIVILAGGINADGSLPAIPKKRVERGAGLYRRKIAPKIIMSGKYGFWLDSTNSIPTRSEAVAMREYAETLNVPTEDILLDEASKDTVGNAYFTKVDTLEGHNWKNIVVVTSRFHMPRAEFIFNTVLGPNYEIEYVSADDSLSDGEAEELELKERKTIKVLKTLMLGIQPGDTRAIGNLLFSKHPGYAKNPEISFEELKRILGK
jgi:uncharacterized SAM-binding protein YcdF (DUF218 family)